MVVMQWLVNVGEGILIINDYTSATRKAIAPTTYSYT